LIKNKKKNITTLIYTNTNINTLSSAYQSKIQQESNSTNNLKNITSNFSEKNLIRYDDNIYFLDEQPKENTNTNIFSNQHQANLDLVNREKASTREVVNKDIKESTTNEGKDTKDIFQSVKHAQFRKNKDKDTLKLAVNHEKENVSRIKHITNNVEETFDNKTTIKFDSLLSFKNLNFDNNNHHRDKAAPNKSNNRTTNLNQDNSIVKTKKKRDKEIKKENCTNNLLLKNNQITNNLNSFKKISFNNFDSISLNSNNGLNNSQNNISSYEKTIKDKDNNTSFNTNQHKGNRKSNKNISTSSILGSNLTILDSNSSNNDNFKFSLRPNISDFVSNDSNLIKKNNIEEQEDDLLKILQKNVKEANDNKSTLGEKKKRFYENYLI